MPLSGQAGRQHRLAREPAAGVPAARWFFRSSMRAARERIRGRLAGWAKESSFPAAGYGWMALTRRKTGARGPAAEHASRLCLMKRAADSPGGVTRSPVARTGRQPPADAEAERRRR